MDVTSGSAPPSGFVIPTVEPTSEYIELVDGNNRTFKLEVEPSGSGTFRLLTTSEGGAGATETSTQTLIGLMTDLLASSLQIENAAEDPAPVNIGWDINGMFDGVTSLTVHRAAVDISADGTIIAGVADKKIRVLACMLICGAAQTIKFWSNSGAGAPLSGVMSFAANGGFVLSPFHLGWLQSANNGEGIYADLGNAVQTGGIIVYVEV